MPQLVPPLSQPCNLMSSPARSRALAFAVHSLRLRQSFAGRSREPVFGDDRQTIGSSVAAGGVGPVTVTPARSAGFAVVGAVGGSAAIAAGARQAVSRRIRASRIAVVIAKFCLS